ncbi:uncharacterized protein LOC110099758 [Dendrobium catenatum]|uniref:DUF4408 domain-containing protein n=1 Tax=Dendrobium catenatum TaxID=906689 RepID=A0A2I0X9K8_9ASPA|nr:uncharacterized protein LOC110099758 [Dendrobium catenatum]PKU84608.1 hypothetical protein MA16_Dca015467 [Dendrobium catenatum]
MGRWMLSVKIVAASAAVFSSAVALQLASQPVTEFLVAEGPRFYKSIASWLTPPYLYFIINGIIISIAATSRFQKTMAADSHLSLGTTLSAPPPSISADQDLPEPIEYISKVTEDARLSPEFLAPEIGPGKGMELPESAADSELEEGFVISRSSWSPNRRGSSENLLEKSAAVGSGGATPEKPPVSARLGRRKSIKASPEGKALRVTRPRKHETLESTWRTITDGRPVPLARHLKKADTWDTQARATAADPAPPSTPAMRKSESIAVPSSATGGPPSSPSVSSGSSSLSAGKIRREPSLGQDDLNRRVEAFIKKFNEEMRLQRQESLQQYMDMINSSGQ